MSTQSKKSNTKFIAAITILSIIAVGTIISTICLAWSLATANEKIDYLEKKVDKLTSEVGEPDGPIYDDPDDPFVAKKPLIYLYPTEDMNVSVKLGAPSKLTATYPKYNDGWNVFAHKDGTLIANGRSYYGLYWEGANYDAKQTNEGFIVAGKESAAFLETKLAQLGLTEREANEMIIYWLPKLEKNAYNYIRFDLNKELDAYMPMNVSPKPDAMIRVLMAFKGLEKPISVREQKLETPERKGFVVVEWGGCEIK